MMLEKTRSRSQAKRPRRLVCKAHLAYVASQPCCVPLCGRPSPSNVHHLRVPGSGACAGRRSADNFAVPLCPEHHQGQFGVHGYSSEVVRWKIWEVDPLALAAQLWRESQAGKAMP